MDPPDGGQPRVGQVRDAQVRHSLLHPRPYGGGNGGGLLVDFLEHKVGVSALFGGLHVPVGGEAFPLNRLPQLVIEDHAVRLADHHVPFFQDAVAAGVFQDGGDIRRQEVLPFPVSHNQGAFPPDGEQGIGEIPEQHRQGVAAPNPGQGLGQGFQGLAVVAAVNQFDQDLGVGLADKGIVFGLQHLFQGAIVLNDAVVDDAHIGGGMGMAVDVAGFPVGGPAGMADAAVAHRQSCGGFLGQFGPKRGQTSLGLDHPNGVRGFQGHPSRIIAAVLQFGQTIQQYILGAAGAHIAYNATHKQNTSMAGRPPVFRACSASQGGQRPPLRLYSRYGLL